MRQVYDVIVIGAGPAGCAAARTLAKANLSVGLFDKAVFPRDKICGDALIPDAHHALEKLGLVERVTRIAFPAQGMRLIGFDGSNVLVRAVSACVPRLKLDELLVKSAVEGGAEFLPGHELVNVVNEDATNYRVEFSYGAQFRRCPSRMGFAGNRSRCQTNSAGGFTASSREQKLCRFASTSVTNAYRRISRNWYLPSTIL